MAFLRSPYSWLRWDEYESVLTMLADLNHTITIRSLFSF